MASERDPHGIVPDEFQYESLREAKKDTTTTDPDTLPRCPECKSHNIRRKRKRAAYQPQKKPGEWKCHNNNCLHHFSDPLPPEKEEEGSE